MKNSGELIAIALMTLFLSACGGSSGGDSGVSESQNEADVEGLGMPETLQVVTANEKKVEG